MTTGDPHPRVRLIVAPYDSGVRDLGTGLGPSRLLRSGLDAHLADRGYRVSVETIDLHTDPLMPEAQFAGRLARAIAARVRDARASDSLPVVLAGSCYSALGTVTGIAAGSPSVFWFDSHADFNTPESTTSGFVDGMAVAMLTGRCWRHVTAGIEGFRPVDERRVHLLGVRDVDPAEARQLRDTPITVLPPKAVSAGLAALPGDHAGDAAYLHLDLDVLDPGEGRANALAAPNGMLRGDVRDAIRAIGAALPVAAAAVTAYDPAYDDAGRVGRAAFEFIDCALEQMVLHASRHHLRSAG